MSRPVISVIMPTYNRGDMLAGALESLVSQVIAPDVSFELVVVDNASTDGTKDVVQEAARTSRVPVRYCYHPVPGPAPARNRGIAEAHGQWLAFFDDDELADENWLQQLYTCALENHASIVGGAMHLDLPADVLQRLGSFVRTTLLREINYYPKVQCYDRKRLPGTNNALVARQVFETVGCFENSKIGAGSDSDFFLRARHAGIDLWYTPYAIVRHRVAENRLTTDYFRWDAQQGCSAFASLDYKHKGASRLALTCLLRFLHAGAIVGPRLAWAWIRRDEGALLGERVRLWRTEGYVRTTFALLAPHWFPQERYFADLHFRRGRVVGHAAQGEPAT
jgi:GT2 family glycosyltransferase